MKKKVVTIGGGNGHSNILGGIYHVFLQKIELSAIVSMSDDGRTTGRLMRYFHEDIGIHFPPPGDLRRCLYFLSASPYRDEFQKYFEFIIQDDILIASIDLGTIARIAGVYQLLEKLDFPYFHAKLPIRHSLEGHKFGNIFMAFLFYHLDKNYDAMMQYMHILLDVRGNVLPVTTDRAYIQATLADGRVIEKQDNISNVAGYSSRIVHLSLMPGSHDAKHQDAITTAIRDTDYIVISPGDLYTSTISNLIIGGVRELIAESSAKIIYIANTTNKGGETTNYAILDFVNELEKYLGKGIDTVIANNFSPVLTPEQEELLKIDISVKGGQYIFLSDSEKEVLFKRGIHIIEDNILDSKSLYKHDSIKLAKILEGIVLLG